MGARAHHPLSRTIVGVHARSLCSRSYCSPPTPDALPVGAGTGFVLTVSLHMVPMLRRSRWTVSAEDRVSLHLIGREYLRRSQVILEMRVSQFGLRNTDQIRLTLQTLRRNRTIGELPIEGRLLVQQFRPERQSFSLHRVEQVLDARLLLGRESELVGKLEHVCGPWVAVQF